MSTEISSWLGQVLSGDRYQIIARLGEGGMGCVYRARDRHLACDVVIKVPRPALLQEPEFAARFAQEIRSLVRLTHPHIVKITDVGTHDGVPFAVMQYLPGGSLRDRQPVGRDGTARPRPPEELRSWLPEVATALDFIHGQNFIHRDVKPDNILFDQHGNVYLSDFGIAKALVGAAGSEQKTVLTNAGMVLGTAPYMAPEVLLGEPYDGRADQYALAVTVYQLLSGTLPFDGPTPAAVMMQQAAKGPPPLHEQLRSVPKALAVVVHKAMNRDPRQRFPSCRAFADAVLAAALGQPLSARAPEPKEQFQAAQTLPALTRVTCPECRKHFRLPAMTPGQRVCCPNCKSVFAPQELLPVSRVTRPDSKTDVDLGEPVYAETFTSGRSNRTDPLPQTPPGGQRLRSVARGPGWLSRLPTGAVVGIGALAVVLVTVAAWLVLRSPSPAPAPVGGGNEQVREVPIDSKPRIDYQVGTALTFGVLVPQEGAGKPADFKRLTFHDTGWTNCTVVRVNGAVPVDFGDSKRGNRLRTNIKIRSDAVWESQSGSMCEWQVMDAASGDPILITQTVEIVPSKQPVALAGGVEKRLLNTLLVRYRIENKGRRRHEVGLRTMVDTLIGKEDGVPFAGPGIPTLVSSSTFADLHRDQIPDFIQALETPNIRNPGTVAQLGFKPGGKLETPSRVILTHWAGVPLPDNKGVAPSLAWDIPAAPIKNDSAVVIYWNDKFLEPNETREVGFTYGLGHVDASQSAGKLGVTLGGLFAPKDVFHVMAYVSNPSAGQTVTLNLPPELTLAEGNKTVTVPPLPAGSIVGYSIVSWKVQGTRPGRYTLSVQSSTGPSQAHAVTIFSAPQQAASSPKKE